MAYPGIREKLYLAGSNVSVGPSGYSPQWTDISVSERLASTALQIERPLDPWIGAPVAILKLSGSIPWSTVAEEDLPAMESLAASARSFDFADWRPVTALFNGDGSNKTFALPWRLALASVPTGLLPVSPTYAAARYATIVTVDGVVDTGVVWGAVDAAYHLPFTLSLTPDDAEENISVYCVPLYLVRRVGMDKSYPSNNQEGRVFHFEEVA